MMIHAYSEDYLNNAQKILGDMMDYAVNTYEFSPNQFYEMFLYRMCQCSFRQEIRLMWQERPGVNW